MILFGFFDVLNLSLSKKSPVPYFSSPLDVFFRGLNSVEFFIKFSEQKMLTKDKLF